MSNAGSVARRFMIPPVPEDEQDCGALDSDFPCSLDAGTNPPQGTPVGIVEPEVTDLIIDDGEMPECFRVSKDGNWVYLQTDGEHFYQWEFSQFPNGNPYGMVGWTEPWDIGTQRYDNMRYWDHPVAGTGHEWIDNFVSSYSSRMGGFDQSADGTIFFFTDNDADYLTAVTVSTPYNIKTYTGSTRFRLSPSLSGGEDVCSMRMAEDGTQVFFLTTRMTVIVYLLPVAWDISSMTRYSETYHDALTLMPDEMKAFTDEGYDGDIKLSGCGDVALISTTRATYESGEYGDAGDWADPIHNFIGIYHLTTPYDWSTLTWVGYMDFLTSGDDPDEGHRPVSSFDCSPAVIQGEYWDKLYALENWNMDSDEHRVTSNKINYCAEGPPSEKTLLPVMMRYMDTWEVSTGVLAHIPTINEQQWTQAYELRINATHSYVNDANYPTTHQWLMVHDRTKSKVYRYGTPTNGRPDLCFANSSTPYEIYLHEHSPEGYNVSGTIDVFDVGSPTIGGYVYGDNSCGHPTFNEVCDYCWTVCRDDTEANFGKVQRYNLSTVNDMMTAGTPVHHTIVGDDFSDLLARIDYMEVVHDSGGLEILMVCIGKNSDDDWCIASLDMNGPTADLTNAKVHNFRDSAEWHGTDSREPDDTEWWSTMVQCPDWFVPTFNFYSNGNFLYMHIKYGWPMHQVQDDVGKIATIVFYMDDAYDISTLHELDGPGFDWEWMLDYGAYYGDMHEDHYYATPRMSNLIWEESNNRSWGLEIQQWPYPRVHICTASLDSDFSWYVSNTRVGPGKYNDNPYPVGPVTNQDYYRIESPEIKAAVLQPSSADLTFYTGSTMNHPDIYLPWYVETTGPSVAATAGTTYARSPQAVDQGETSWVEFTVQSQGDIEFDWGGSARNLQDYMWIFLNQYPYVSTTGSFYWQTLTLTVDEANFGPPPYTFRLMFWRNYYDNPYQYNGGFLDRVIWTPA